MRRQIVGLRASVPSSVAGGLARATVRGNLFFARVRGDSGDKVSGGQAGFYPRLVEGVIIKGQAPKP